VRFIHAMTHLIGLLVLSVFFHAPADRDGAATEVAASWGRGGGDGCGGGRVFGEGGSGAGCGDHRVVTEGGSGSDCGGG